jgi:alkylation response protein AidB-like acyl-CoA dehydrogenase
MSTTVTLNADQEEIRQVARGFLESRFPSDRVRELMATPDGFSEDSWQQMSELGWAGIALPEDAGGAGYSFVERCLLLEEMGRVLCPAPYLSSAVLAADAVLLAGEGELADEILAALAAGERRATLVAAGDLLASGRPAGAVSAAPTGDTHALNGDGSLVLDGASAELLVVCAALAEEEVGLFAVEADAAGVERTAAPIVDATRKTARIFFDGAPARRLDGGGDTDAVIAVVLDRGAVSLSAEMVGGARRAIEMTVSYMGERQQFGGPIGRFQALKHRLADLHVSVDAAREGVYSAADAIASGDTGQVPMAAAAAKAGASRAYVTTTAEAVQLHGGIGFTEEHDIGLFYKRALGAAPMFGGREDELERIATGLGV